MMFEKDVFVSYSKEMLTSVRIGDGSSMNVQGKGDVEIALSKNGQSILAKLKVFFIFQVLITALCLSLVQHGFKTTFVSS